MIRVSDLRVDYDDFCAVQDLSLNVMPGQVCGLIGPNGAGKTTTMKAMLGLLEPTYGEIEIAGIDMREHPREASRLVGFMPDFPPLYEDLLCWEFVDLFAASYGVPKAKRPDAVEQSLRTVGMMNKRNAPITELSRGMRQRLMLAKTLIPDPPVLILDEPASGVDPQGRILLRNILKAQAAAGKTVLISSHILTEMSEFCTEMAVLEAGRLIVGGSIDDVRQRIMGASLLAVEVIGSPERFLQVVGRDDRASLVEEIDGRFEFRFAGDADDAADLLKLLIDEGVRVSAFSRRKEGLEELFLQLGSMEIT